MQHEDPDGDDVGVTQVVDEAADVAIVTGVNAVYLSVLKGRHHSSHLLLTLLAWPTSPPKDHPVPPP